MMVSQKNSVALKWSVAFIQPFSLFFLEAYNVTLFKQKIVSC